MRKTNPGRQGARWRRAAASVEGEVCFFCHRRIPTHDELRYGKWMFQPWNHPLARTVHHLIHLADAATPEELEALALNPDLLVVAHRSCNSSDNRKDPGPPAGSGTPSRDW